MVYTIAEVALFVSSMFIFKYANICLTRLELFLPICRDGQCEEVLTMLSLITLAM